MKTIEEWLKTLPEPYRRRALKNMNKNIKENKCCTQHAAIMDGLNWSESPQGVTYWEKLFLKLQKQEIMKKTSEKVESPVKKLTRDQKYKQVISELEKENDNLKKEKLGLETLINFKDSAIKTHQSMISNLSKSKTRQLKEWLAELKLKLVELKEAYKSNDTVSGSRKFIEDSEAIEAEIRNLKNGMKHQVLDLQFEAKELEKIANEYSY